MPLAPAGCRARVTAWSSWRAGRSPMTTNSRRSNSKVMKSSKPAEMRAHQSAGSMRRSGVHGGQVVHRRPAADVLRRHRQRRRHSRGHRGAEHRPPGRVGRPRPAGPEPRHCPRRSALHGTEPLAVDQAFNGDDSEEDARCEQQSSCRTGRAPPAAPTTKPSPPSRQPTCRCRPSRSAPPTPPWRAPARRRCSSPLH